MKNRKIIYLGIVLVIVAVRFFKKEKNISNNSFTNATTVISSGFDYLPTSTTGQIVKHNGYTLSYNEPHEQAEWVAYSLNGKDIVRSQRKRPYFEIDYKVKSKSAHWKNYKKSGYDRGHLCPAADRRKTKSLYDETFLTSNASPQKHEFNAGIWNKLEQKTRYWAKKYKNLYVVSGGILKGKNFKTIGSEKVTVPNYFYKILLDYTKPEIKAIAFLLPHKDSNKPLYEFVVSIDELEKKTGINFFPSLPDHLENKLEASSSYKNWSFRE